MYNTDSPEQALTNIDIIHGDGIFILRDFARYCDNDKICRRLRDLTEKFRNKRRSIVITAASLTLPPDLFGDSVPFQIGLPTSDAILPAVRTAVVELSNANHIAQELNADGMRQLAKNLAGLPQEEALRTLRLCILSGRKIDDSLLAAVLDAKRAALRGDGLLESVRRDKSFNDVSGLKRLRDWINKRKSALTPEGQKFGLQPPKGILITGVQGCGKSLAARAVAGEWGYELARLDAGTLYDKFVGAKRSTSRKKWRRWSCGSTKSKKPSLQPAAAAMPMQVYRNACWRPC